MDKVKKSRSVQRMVLTKSITTLRNMIEEENMETHKVRASLCILEDKMKNLKILDESIYQNLIETDTPEEELINEIDKTMDYESNFIKVQLQVEEFLSKSKTCDSITNSSNHNETSNCEKRKFKLPKIELVKFKGDLKDWLGFWGQFKKINDDISIPNEDKIQYLLLATAPGSKAREIVESFPASGDNYVKAIDCLKERFGKEDLLIEVYVRELLNIILQNSTSTNKIQLSSLFDKLECQLRALESLKVTKEKCAAILMPLVESCLPEEVLRVWQRTAESREEPEFRLNKLLTFLRKEVENEQRITLSKSFEVSTKSKCMKIPSEQPATAAGLLVTHNDNKNSFKRQQPQKKSGNNCIFCNGKHESHDCLNKMSLEDRNKLIREGNYCFKCLLLGHSAKRCRKFVKCLRCGRQHYILMCPSFNNSESKETDESNKAKSEPVDDKSLTNTSNDLNVSSSNQVLLQTLSVYVRNGEGEKQRVRAIIDSGSQRSYLLNSVVEQLKYQPTRKENLRHCLFGGQQATISHSCYKVHLESTNGEYRCNFDVLGQNVICGAIPSLESGIWQEELAHEGIQLTDIFSSDGKIELLIGADVAGSLLTGRYKRLKSGLVAVETHLGWTLMGKIPNDIGRQTMSSLSMLSIPHNISELWTLDILGIRDPAEMKSEEEAQQEIIKHFENSVTVNDQGRYVVSMPWLQGHPPLPSNYESAYRRMKMTKGKLIKEGLLKLYEDVFKNWMEEGIIEEVYNDDFQKGHFLPHRPVLKPNSTTKIRPVFDASARQKGGPSLNDCIDSGPNFIELIPKILNRFRLKKIGVIADIKKAFLQIELQENDREFVKFLWEDSEGGLRVFRHRRVVFGVTCSPFLLGATINHHLKIIQDRLEEQNNSHCSATTFEKLQNSFYVDNCLISFDYKEESELFAKEATHIMALGQFELRGWESTEKWNGSFLINDTTNEEENSMSLVLGLRWDRVSDTLSIPMQNITVVEKLTKRIILSIAQRVFDPIGFSSPVALQPKLILRELWKEKLGWDEEVSESTKQSFLSWFENLHLLSEVKIPRWLSGSVEIAKRSLHLFCDASQMAYAAVLFLRIESAEGVNVQLVQAKARVAPIKAVSIPRLELLAATIGARMYATLLDSLSPIDESIFWSDSATVIAWINREDQWAPFVGNRVREIKKLTNSNWRHIAGLLNPADLPSRGCNCKELLRSRWWDGPQWLRDPPIAWPKSICNENEDEIIKEKKKSVVSMMNSKNVDTDDWYFRKFSSFTKTVRVIAWICRFYGNLHGKHVEGELNSNEIMEAEIKVFKLVQQQRFCGVEDERIRSLCPFFDDKGVIRLKTKIVQREDTFSFRHPIVLPPDHPLVERLIRENHIRACHAGVQTLLNILREKVWILSGRRAVKSVVTKCVVCKRYSSKRIETLESTLPRNRVRDASAFEVTGVDLAGPLYLRDGQKAWICLFTCAVFRAVHLELLTSLSTDAFLQGFRRFVARRGRPSVLFSDNGLNFVGAENAFSALDWSTIASYSSAQRIKWKFIPPAAPWWGGWWERLVGVVKQLLKKVLGKAKLRYEELLTALCDCEAIVNSRPITYQSDSPNELVPLSPAMFIQDIREVGVPDCDMVQTIDFKKRYNYRMKLMQDLRKRFRIEYLGKLKQRSKNRKTQQLSVGDVVMVGMDDVKRLDWPLARIEELLPGRDGVTRLVRLRTSTGGSLLRPVQRLYLLESSDYEEEQKEEENLQIENSLEEEHEAEEEKEHLAATKTKRGRVVRPPPRFLD